MRIMCSKEEEEGVYFLNGNNIATSNVLQFHNNCLSTV